MPVESGLPLPVAMLAVYAAAKLLAEVFERFKQPAIIGEILAGVVLGPSLLAWIHPEPRLDMLAEVGVLFLLFTVGLEVDAAQLWAVRGTATLVATLGVLVPLGAGWALMRAFGSQLPKRSLSAPRWWPPALASLRKHWRPEVCSTSGPVRLFSRPPSLTTCWD